MSALDDYFDGKPKTREIFEAVRERIAALGPGDVEVRTQISFGVERKFAWFWLYNVTGKNPDGILHLMLALDEKVDDPHVREVTRIGERRWNHQIVIRTREDAQSSWLGELLRRAYHYGAGSAS